MTRAAWLALVIGAGVGAVACAPRAPQVTIAHVDWASTRWPGVTRTELEHGRTVYLHKCSGCHLPPAPGSQTPESWPGHIEEMRERAHLEPGEVALIEKYVVTLASLH